MNTVINENGFNYILGSDERYYPALKYNTTESHYEKYGLLRKQFLQGIIMVIILLYYFTENLLNI